MTFICAQAVEKIVLAVAKEHGLSSQHGLYLAKGMIEPSLRGIDSHGIRLLSTYIKELEGGRAKAKPVFKQQGDFKAVVQFDAGDALGMIAGFEATNVAATRAKECGIAAVCVKNSNHFGSASNYTLALAEQGLIGICLSNADSLVAPFNGIDKMFGTNPFSFAAPSRGDEIYCLDMATSHVSLSKILRCQLNQQPIAEHWIVQTQVVKDQLPTLLPLGGYKGQGLAMMIAIMTGLLADSLVDNEMSHLYTPPYDKPRQVSHLIIALNISAFVDQALFQSRLSEFMFNVRQSRSSGTEDVVVAGDPEVKAAEIRRVEGIPVDSTEFEFYSRLADQYGIAI